MPPASVASRSNGSQPRELAGVIDVTTHELADLVAGGV